MISEAEEAEESLEDGTNEAVVRARPRNSTNCESLGESSELVGFPLIGVNNSLESKKFAWAKGKGSKQKFGSSSCLRKWNSPGSLCWSFYQQVQDRKTGRFGAAPGVPGLKGVGAPTS